jgi:hypothetical protein
VLAAFVLVVPAARAQTPRRLELADSAHLDPSRQPARRDSARVRPVAPRAVAPADSPMNGDELRGFVVSTGIHGALAGAGLAYAADVEPVRTGAAIVFGAIGGVAAGVATGRSMSAGQANAALFGANFGMLAGFGVATMANGSDASDRARFGLAAGGMLIGVPLGAVYASLAPYRITTGDVDALWTASAVGALTGWAFVANSHPTDRATAAALTFGGIAGAVAGDRFLVQPYDHSPSDAGMLTLGAAGGALAGAGAGVFFGGSHDRFGSYTAAFTAGGAIAGMVFAEHYLVPHSAARGRFGRLQVDAAGVVATLSRANGTHSLLRYSF